MEKEKTTMLRVPVYWERLILSVLCGCGVLMLMHFGIDAMRPRIPHEILLCVCIIGVLRSLICYAISEESLDAYFVCIPYRRICWKDIKAAVYITPETNKRAQVVFFLTPVEQNKNVLTRSELEAFQKKHPFQSVKISLPMGDEEKYIRFIEECLETTLTKI